MAEEMNVRNAASLESARVKVTARNRGMSRAARVAVLSSQIFLALVIFQVPLFRVPCKAGVCKSPLELTAVQLASSKAAPPSVLKAILFPGACLHDFVVDLSLPSWDSILTRYNMTNLEGPSTAELLRLEVIAGSYFAVAGAIVGAFKQGRMSMFGMLLLTWGLIKEGIFSKQSTGNSVQASPMLIFAVVLSFMCVRYDFQKMQTITRPAVKPLKSSTKAKIK